jgi:hypothetical protein
MVEIILSIVTIIKALSTALTVWDVIRVRNVSTGFIFGEFSIGSSVAGTAGADSGAAQVCAAPRFPTGIARVTGRKYLGPLSEGNLGTNGVLASAAVTAVANYMSLMINPHVRTNGTYEFGYLSPKTAQFEVFLSGVCSTIPSALRSRKPGVGS